MPRAIFQTETAESGAAGDQHHDGLRRLHGQSRRGVQHVLRSSPAGAPSCCLPTVLLLISRPAPASLLVEQVLSLVSRAPPVSSFATRDASGHFLLLCFLEPVLVCYSLCSLLLLHACILPIQALLFLCSKAHAWLSSPGRIEQAPGPPVCKRVPAAGDIASPSMQMLAIQRAQHRNSLCNLWQLAEPCQAATTCRLTCKLLLRRQLLSMILENAWSGVIFAEGSPHLLSAMARPLTVWHKRQAVGQAAATDSCGAM